MTKIKNIALMAFLLSAPNAWAAAGGGIDTPEGVTTLPLSVQGMEGLRLVGDGTSAPDTIINGNVGVGTAAPRANLDVAGEGKFGSSGAACSPQNGNAGAVRYNSATSSMEYCNGSSWSWASMSGGPAGTWCGLYNYVQSTSGFGGMTLSTIRSCAGAYISSSLPRTLVCPGGYSATSIALSSSCTQTSGGGGSQRCSTEGIMVCIKG